MHNVSWKNRKVYITALYFFIYTLIITILTLLLFNNMSKNIETMVEYNQNSIAVRLTQNIDLSLHYLNKNLSLLCEDAEVKNFFASPSYDNDSYLKTRLTEFLVNESNLLYSVYLYKPDTNEIMTESGRYNLDNFPDNQWLDSLEKLHSKRSVWVLPHVSEILGSYYRTVSYARTYPLITSYDSIQGYIIINMNTNIFKNYFEGDASYNENAYFVTNEDNEILFSMSNYFVIDENDVINSKDLEHNGSKIVESYGSSYLVCRRKFGTTSWSLYSVSPYNKIISQINNYKIQITVIAILLWFIVSLIMIISTKWLNKPINKFLDTINKNSPEERNVHIEELSDMFKRLSDRQKMLTNQVKSNLPYIKSQMINEVIKGNITSYSQLDSKYKVLKDMIYGNNYIIMLTSIDNVDLIFPNPDENTDIYMSTIYNKLEELGNDVCKAISIQIFDTNAITLLSFDEYDNSQNTSKARGIAEKLRRFIKECFGITVTSAISGCQKEFSAIPDLYNEALKLLMFRPSLGTNNIITADDIDINIDGMETDIAEYSKMIETLCKTLYIPESKEYKNVLREIFDAMSKAKLPSNTIIKICIQIIRSGYSVYNKFANSDEQYGYYDQIEHSLSILNDIEQIEGSVNDILDEISNEIAVISDKNRKNNDVINRVLEFINRNYSNPDLSLQSVSERFHFSVPYLSKIFKNATGQSFTDKLIEIRMEKACELLSHSNININDISVEVGYIHTSSFIRTFKRYTKLTPALYRENMKSE